MLMKASYVDFHAVKPEHHAVHARLENWARWARGRGSSGATCPMFRLYRAPRGRDLYVQVGVAIDSADAAKVQKSMAHLPQSHRLALAWCYITRANPRKAAQQLGESMDGLMALIHAGRQMLLNAGG